MFSDLADALSGVAFAVLGEEATVISSEGEATVACLFTEAIRDGETMDPGNPVGLSYATLEIRPSALSFKPEAGDLVRARGMEFTVVDVTRDACGNIRLLLHR